MPGKTQYAVKIVAKSSLQKVRAQQKVNFVNLCQYSLLKSYLL
jgi:hypothetical protein